MTTQNIDTRDADRIADRLSLLYGDAVDEVLPRIVSLIDRYRCDKPDSDSLWNQTDIVLITYGDQVQSRSDDRRSASPLATQRQFLLDRELDKLIRLVHVLPFSPFSSDDGFSVIDFREVNPDFGTWADIEQLGQHFDLVFDLVLNHASQHCDWFQRFLLGEQPYRDYFISIDPGTDLSQVTRPRSLPLLTQYKTADGPKHVWTTFSDDQVDLNYESPDLLLEMLDILLMYAEKGARIIRLDAIAYLWKQIGTNCIHLPRTHEVVKLMRNVLEAANSRTLLLSETNVPHRENVSYFGDGDEAHLVYQFSLPPLLLDAFLRSDATPLMDWLSDLEPAAPGTTYFNFTASHDGIGVRPLEGLVTPKRLQQLVADVKSRGGRVSTRRNPDGSDSPYELNITWFSALGDPAGISDELHCRRFISSQAVMLALRGMPAIYFHSLVGSPNDLEGAATSGHARRINRRKYDRSELDAILDDDSNLQSKVFQAYKHLIGVRIAQAAFHPEALQETIAVADPSLIVFERRCENSGQRIVCVTNVSPGSKELSMETSAAGNLTCDLISAASLQPNEAVRLEAYQTMWLTD